MECSQAVLMLMLLVPCEQSGGKSPENVYGERLEAAPVVQAAPAADNPRLAESLLQPAAAATASIEAAAPDAAERNPSGDHRVPD